MHKSNGNLPLPGKGAGDPHRNTAKCGGRNDRERRRAKRLEREQVRRLRRRYA